MLAGGLATRLGGIDKTALEIDGLPILERITGGLADAGAVVVVGPEVRGGPALAMAAGLERTTAARVVTLAGDQPFVAAAVPALLTALDGHDAAVLTAEGHLQYLAAAWRRDALDAALAAIDDLIGWPVRRLFDDVDVVEVLDEAGWSRDVDTAADLVELRAAAAAQARRDRARRDRAQRDRARR